MDEDAKRQLTSNGLKISLQDYDLVIHFDETTKFNVLIKFYKKGRGGEHPIFTFEDVDLLIQDLKDLSDWRHYRRLKTKINSKDE